jgi:hypothetical protein
MPKRAIVVTTQFRNDPVNNAINDGIKKAIRACLGENCYGAATTLIYAGIDAMAFLSMPRGQNDVMRSDFTSWCDKYIRLSGATQIEGIEYYGARCAMLHSYGVASRLSREGKCRQIGYVDRSMPVVRYDPTIDPGFILLSIDALAQAFFQGVDRFLIDAFSDPDQASVVEARLRHIVVQYQINGSGTPGQDSTDPEVNPEKYDR